MLHLTHKHNFGVVTLFEHTLYDDGLLERVKIEGPVENPDLFRVIGLVTEGYPLAHFQRLLVYAVLGTAFYAHVFL